jgi:hypothetical protein
MLVAPNDLVIEGGVSTVRLAVLLAAPAPLCVAETAPVVFDRTPVVVAATFTAKVHELLTGIVPPASDTLPEAAVAVIAPAPQVPVMPFGVEMTIPGGSVSVKLTPVSATALAAGFVMVKLSEVEPFSGRAATPNNFAIVGGVLTLTLAEAVLPVPPLVELTAPVVLVKLPEAIPVTFTEKVQEELIGRDAPTSDALPEPALAVIVPPPQVPINPFGVEITSPAGRLSVKATPVCGAVFATGLVTVNVSEVEPPSAIPVAPKAFAIDGGASTDRVADAVPPVPPCTEIMLPVVLFFVPVVVPVTLTAKVQELLCARVAPDRLTAPVA